jgi:K+ transporter
MFTIKASCINRVPANASSVLHANIITLLIPVLSYFQEFTLGSCIVLTLQTLGVVFGDVGTSPLYTFDVMFNKYPITAKEDVLGALSLVIYTLILIPFLKYTLIVLWGNDDGEGILLYLYQGTRVN